MGFVQTGFLFTLAALAVPLLVHLLSRWQVRRLELGTMRFLQEVIHDAARRRRIRRWLLLMTRLTLVGLLGLLFTRPFLLKRDSYDGGRLRIVLIDRSASMATRGQSGRVLDDAVSEATELMEQAGSDAVVEWAWFDRQVEPLPAGSQRPSATKSMSTDTDYIAALSWARDRLAASPGAKAEVILVSDMQLSGLSSDSTGTVESGQPLNFPKNVPVRVVDVGRPAANNLAIIGLESQATQLPPGSHLQIAATLFNYASLPAEEVPATATAVCGQKSVRLKKTFNVAADQAEEIAFDFGPVDPGIWEITVDIDASDDLAMDNRRLTSVEVMEPLKILLLDPGSSDNESSACSFYLATALRQGTVLESLAGATDGSQFGSESTATAFSRFTLEQCFVEDQGMPSLYQSPPPLIIVADGGALPLSALQQLQGYVRDGGRLLVFAGQDISSQQAEEWASTQLAPGILSRPERSSVMPFRIVSISDRGSMLDPFRDPQHGDLTRLAFTSLVRADVNDKSRVLAWFDGQRPAITEHAVGKGRVAWFLSSADNRSSNWTLSPLYLPLVRQMAAGLLGIAGEGPVRFRSVGDSINDELAGGSEPTINQVSNQFADGKGRAKAQSNATVTFEQPGFHRRAEALFVVNTLPKESDPTRIDVPKFAEQCGLTLAGVDAEQLGKVEVQSRQELWPWLAAALIVLLVAEFGLANRTPA